MDNIIEPDDSFDFSKLSLAHPVSIAGSAYFTKIVFEGGPLYIQTPKSSTKQGFFKAPGKKIFCDLMFENTESKFIHWLESLEARCQELIYEKSSEWFQNSLDLSDIETSFNSPMKSFKSGKYYLVRTNVKINSLTSNPLIKIYNESETPLSLEDITFESNIISILEVQGIKFTTRNFQIEIEHKQVMLLNKDILFENCLIKKKTTQGSLQNVNSNKLEVTEKTEAVDEDGDGDGENKTILVNTVPLETDDYANKIEEISDSILEEITTKEESGKEKTEPKSLELELQLNDEENTILDIEPATSIKYKEDEKNTKSSDNNLLLIPSSEIEDLEEVNFGLDLENNLETMTLKKPNEVYYEMYKQAREKAKNAKKEALMAFLEAKNIKQTYMLEDIDSSDESSFSDEEEFEKENFY
jgi:hypothetical protein